MDQSVQTQLATPERKEYTGIPLRILKLLGAGVLASEAAKVVGVDESYVSQLNAEPEFKKQVNEIVVKTFAEQSEIDNNYVEIERKLSERLLKTSEFMLQPDQILRTLKFVNEAKKKMPTPVHGANNGNSGEGGRGITQLIVPIHLAQKFILNPNNEIVALDSQVLTTLPSGNINQFVLQKKSDYQKMLESKPASMEVLKKDNANGSRQVDPWSDL
jgi:hypothetical protein